MNIPIPSSVIITEDGMHTPSTAMASLPIDDQSSLWGTWIRATRRDDQGEATEATNGANDPAASDEDENAVDDYQLILTPLPPDTWPVSFCLQLQLSNTNYSYACATQVIHALGLNIVTVRSATTGFHHNTFTLVCEAPELRRRAYHHTRSLRHSLSPSRVKLLRTGSLLPSNAPRVTLSSPAAATSGDGKPAAVNIVLSQKQHAQLGRELKPEGQRPGDREETRLVLSESQLKKIRSKVSNRETVSPGLDLDREQVLRLIRHESVDLTADQIAGFFLHRRARDLSQAEKDSIWRDFAFVLAEKLLIRMHEALWCLRLVSHLGFTAPDQISGFVRRFVGFEQRDFDPPDRDAGEQQPSREDMRNQFGALVRALKFVLDHAGEPNGNLEERFRAHLKGGKDGEHFEKAWKTIRKELRGPQTPEDFTHTNPEGFLHHRFLYGTENFLVSRGDDHELFAKFVGAHPLDDAAADGGQSLQRILNGVKHDGEMESIIEYQNMIGDLIDRSDELKARAEANRMNVHQKLRFLLSIDARRRIAKSADGRLLVQLIYLWIKIQGDVVRVHEFKYTRDRQILSASHRRFSETFPNSLKLPLPTRGTLSVDPLHCLARLSPDPLVVDDGRVGPRLVRLIIEYELRFYDPAGKRDRRSRSSAGILDLINRTLLRQDTRIRSYTSQIRDRPRHLESTERPRDCGVVCVDIERTDGSDVNTLVAEVRRAVQDAFATSNDHWPSLKPQLVRLVVKPNWLTQVFISTRFHDEFWRVHSDGIKQICQQHGFEPCVVEDPDAITEDIMKKIENSHCLLQIIPLLSTDPDLASINLSWLHGEYMCAMMKGIPVVRALQVDRNAKLTDWVSVLKVGSAQQFESFVNSTDFLKRALPKLLDRLRNRINGRL